jgi:hypothetical protein
MQKLSENIGSAKTHVEGCSSFLKAAIKWDFAKFQIYFSFTNPLSFSCKLMWDAVFSSNKSIKHV